MAMGSGRTWAAGSQTLVVGAWGPSEALTGKDSSRPFRSLFLANGAIKPPVLPP
jgi:hypothetical protein